MGLCFWLLSYLCPGALYMNGAFVLILKHKENADYTQLVEMLKAKTTSLFFPVSFAIR
jgi:hypothetical protein